MLSQSMSRELLLIRNIFYEFFFANSIEGHICDVNFATRA